MESPETQTPSNMDVSPCVEVNLENDNQLKVLKRMDGMRILFAVDCKFPGQGGAEAQALKLADEMRDRGAYVEFVTPRISDDQPLQEKFHGFKINRIDYPHIRWIGSLMLMLYFARYLQSKGSNFDFLHIHITHLMAASAGFVRKKTGLPVITKISGFYEFEGGVLDQQTRFKPLNYLLRMGLKKVDYVQTISVQTREKLVAANFRPEQICFIPNGINTGQTPRVREIRSPVVIGYCGRLREVKGVHVLIEAISKVRQRRPELAIKLSIAGDGTSKDALQVQANGFGISEDIEWLGLIEDTHAYLRSIDVYVQPSFAEGLPNSVMEAMSEQLPVIATDIGGNNELVEHEKTGLLFQAGDTEALADCIFRMLDEDKQRLEMAGAARGFIEERYDIKQVVNRLAELYRV